MLVSKLPQTESLQLAKASTNSEFSISQKLPVESTTPPQAWLFQTRLSQAGYQAGFQAGFEAGSQPGSQAPVCCIVDLRR